MYFPHHSKKLHDLFSLKPFQGADPAQARFLFFGLDANYDPEIEHRHCFPEIVSYLEDGVRYWRERGYHHPFRNPDYRGDGALYHNRFARIGFAPEHADKVSFVELINVPTYGTSKLKPSDLKPTHIDRLLGWVREGSATDIFIPPGVARLLRQTEQFKWLPGTPVEQQGSLPVLFSSEGKTIFSPYHFSCVGKHCLKKDRVRQLEDIGRLI